MKISSVNSRQSKISHKAVNQKFFNQAKAKYERCAPYHNQLPLLTNISNAEIYGLISSQDAIDTLEAIKPYAQNILDSVDELIDEIKATL